MPWLVRPCCTGCSHTTTTSALACSPVLHWLQSHNNDKCPGLFARVALAAVTQQRQVPWLVRPFCTGCSHTTMTSALACSPLLNWLQSHKCPCSPVLHWLQSHSRCPCSPVLHWLHSHNKCPCSPVLHWLQSHSNGTCPCSPVWHWLQSHNNDRCPCSPMLHAPFL